MPSEDSNPVLSPVPTDDEIAAQLDILCSHVLLKAEKCAALLRFLVRQKQERRYIGPFQPGKRPTGKQLGFEFSREWATKVSEKLPTHSNETEISIKRLVSELATKLDEYYETSEDSVVIAIRRGRNDGYQPLIAYRGDPRLAAIKRAPATAALPSEPTTTYSDNLAHCEYLGNDREAMRYVFKRYNSEGVPLPRLVGLRDTHVRAEMPMRYREDYYVELQTAFANFLSNTDPDLTACTLIFGWEVDTKYVRMVQVAAAESGDKLKCYRLRNQGPLMNFILMDYEDLSTEVLFGWGQGKPGSPGAVFLSHDERMIDEFNNFYDVLIQASDRVPLESLLEKPTTTTRK